MASITSSPGGWAVAADAEALRVSRSTGAVSWLRCLTMHHLFAGRAACALHATRPSAAAPVCETCTSSKPFDICFSLAQAQAQAQAQAPAQLEPSRLSVPHLRSRLFLHPVARAMDSYRVAPPGQAARPYLSRFYSARCEAVLPATMFWTAKFGDIMSIPGRRSFHGQALGGSGLGASR